MFYRVGHVYKIYSELDEDMIYIGSTFRKLEHRLARHKSDYKEKRYNMTSYNIFDIYGVDTCKIELIKSYPVCDREHLYMYEQLYINKLKCVNSKSAFQILYKEWNRLYYQRNKERFLERDRRYREENKERFLERDRRYREEHKEELNEKSRQRYQQNKERHKQYYQDNRQSILKQKSKNGKQYREKNSELIECECGSIVVKYKLREHKTRKKHREFLKNNEKENF
jgi:hypothetical protein